MSFWKEIVNEGIKCFFFANSSPAILEQRRYMADDSFVVFVGGETRGEEPVIRGQCICYD